MAIDPNVNPAQQQQQSAGAPPTFGGMLPNLTTSSDVPPELVVSLEDETPEVDEGVSIVTEGEGRPGVGGKVAEQRAAKTHFALGQDSPGLLSILNSIQNGTEDILRSQLAEGENLRDKELKLQIIREKASKGESITPEDVKFMSGLAEYDPKNAPDTILERKYARSLVNMTNVVGGGVDSVIGQAYRKDPEGLSRKMEVAEELATRQEIVKSAIEDVEAIYQGQSWGGFFVDMAKGFVPFYSSAKLRQSGATGASDSYLKGNVVEDLVNRFWSLPVDKMAVELRDHLNTIAKDNPQLARELANAVLSYTSSDKFLDNAFNVLDVVTAPGAATVGKIALKGATKAGEAVGAKAATQVAKEAPKAADDASTALKHTVQANGAPDTKIENQLNAMGDVDRATDVHIISRAKEILEGADPTGGIKDLTSRLPTLFRPDAIGDATKAPNLHLNQVNRIIDTLKRNSEEIAKTITEAVKVGRLPEEALQAAIRNEAKKLQDQFRTTEDAILDVSWVKPDDTVANVGSVTMSVGDRGGRLFDTLQDAYQMARFDYGLPPGSFKVEQQGVGYKITVSRTVDETDPVVRAAIKTEKNTHNTGFASTMFGWFRSADDRVPQHIREARKTLVHARTKLEASMRQAVKDIGYMSNKATKELDLVMKKNKYEVDEATGDRGRFYNTIEEFETSFHQTHGKFPTEQQTKAYFTYRQFNDWDWVLRNMGVYRDRARQGIEKIILKDQTTDADGTVKYFSPDFYGKVRSELPWNEKKNDTVLIHSSGNDPVRINMLSATPEQRAQIDQLLKEGHKIVEVENPTRVPHEKRFGKDTVNFIITKDVEVHPLSWKQIPYRPGWHTSYPQEWFVKQPKLEYRGGEVLEGGGTSPKSHRYTGDQAVFAFDTEAEAIKYATAMEKARKMYVAGDQGLDDFLRSNLPFTPSKFRSLFEGVGDVPPVLDKNIPFFSTYTGKYTIDGQDVKNQLRTQFENFEDTIREGRNLFANVDKKFLGQRDDPLWTVDEVGSELNPIYRLENAGEIDPILSVQKAMANIIRSREFSDYKIAHTEAWVAQFGHLLDANIDDVMVNPVHHVHNTQFVQRTAANWEELRAAADSKRALVELLGTPSSVQSTVDWLRSKLMSSIYTDASNMGKSGQTVQENVRPYVYRQDRDPVSLMRASAFHLNIGLFNPYQLFQNAMTMTNAIAIGGPRHGAAGAMASWPMRFALNNERILDKMADISRGFGWTPDQFKESLREFKRSGKNLIEGEHSWKDDIADPHIIQSRWGSFLDAGLVLFREGERLTRLAAWNIAYREWRTANPTAVIDDAVRRQLIDRSDLMSANMTRASNATWQQGLMAIPAQFISYHTRLAEQMLGKRLTTAEKARVIGVNSVMFGVPIGLLGSSGLGALTAGQYPWHEEVRKELLKKGFDVNDPMMDAFNNGLLGLASRVITGESTDLSARVGPGGGQLLKNLMADDKAFLDILFGASGSKTGSVFESLDPVTKWVMSPFRGDDEQFPLRPEDVVGVLRNVKTVDSAVNVYYALQYGKLFAKNGQPLTDVSTMDMVFAAATGGNPRKLTDKLLMQGMNIDRTKVVNDAIKRATTNFNAMADALLKNDQAVAEMYRKRLATEMALANLTPQEQARVFQSAIRTSQNKLDQVNWEFIWKKAPADQAPARQDLFLNQGKAN